MNLIFPKNPGIAEKIEMMKDDARFEVGCDADAEATAIACAADIRAKSSPPKIPKIYVSGSCIFNCAYCGCRCTRDKASPYCHTPAETARLAVSAAIKNRHGIFISSAICKNADHTQELIAESVKIIRTQYNYTGFVHAKVMPGADPLLIARTGQYADRLSINIEVARSSGYQRIAKQKNKDIILTPMGQIADQIFAAKCDHRPFAASQTTQLMAGSIDEDDRTIMTLTTALYRKYRLKRVYYTAFAYLSEAKGYESENLALRQTPYWRMARLYQADRLTQLYGFTADDVTPAEDPFLQEDIDPKAAWALRHLDLYPVEVNKADFDTLIRVPGIGITYARKIIEARRYCRISHDILRKMRISLKKSRTFITCDGKFDGGDRFLSNPREILSSSLTI